MRSQTTPRAILFAFILAAATLQAHAEQPDTAPPRFYRLDFLIREVDGTHIVNSRSYSLVSATDPHNRTLSMRTGSKIPMQGSYMDVGVSIDCRQMQEVGSDLSLTVVAEVSSAVPGSADSAGHPPVVRQNKWDSSVIVPLRKPTQIFSSDDVTSDHKLQVELTATPIRP